MSKVFIRIKDNETGLESNEVSIEDIIYNQNDITFIFTEEDGEESTLPYKDFLFFQDDYEVIVRIL